MVCGVGSASLQCSLIAALAALIFVRLGALNNRDEGYFCGGGRSEWEPVADPVRDNHWAAELA